MPTLIGQSIVVDSYTISIAARCQCKDGGSPVLLAVLQSPAGATIAPGACQACGLGYAVQSIDLTPNAQLKFAIAVMSAAPLIKDS